MTAFAGSAAYLGWIWSGGTVVLDSDFRQFDWTPSLAMIDSTAGSDSFREFISGTGEGGDISLSCVMQTDGTVLIGALGRGNGGTLLYGPEGIGSGKPKSIIPAISKGPAYSQPYDGIVDFKISWQQSAVETNTTWGTADYALKVGALNPVAYWPMWESAGTVMYDIINGYNAKYSGITLGATGIGDGNTAATFDGTAGYANVLGTSLTNLAAALDTDEMTVCVWSKVTGAGVWSDGIQRRQCYFESDTDGTNNHFYLRKNTTTDQIRCGRAGSATHKSIDATFNGTDWFHSAMTVSVANNRIRYYINGVQQGSDATTITTLLGAINQVVIGAASGAFFWSGNLAHLALFNRPLTGGEITLLATV